jgi:glycosyltransferase involved in cell wall biosynthesis
MRVLHVLESLAAGGVETTFLNVLRHLPDSITHDVLAFNGGALEAEYRAIATNVHVESAPRALEKIVVKGRYDVAHILFERCANRLMPAFVTRTSTAIVYGKNYDFSGQWRTTEGFVDTTDDAMMAACDGVTFTTPQLAAGYDDQEVERSLILGKGANVTPLLALPFADDSIRDRILVIANPNPRKRLGDLVTALAAIRQDVPSAEVRVIGHGDPGEVERLRALAAELGVADKFELAGSSRDVAGELQQARIVALPSGNEGVPTALLEAMAAGRPVVTTDAGHVRSIVDDGREGFVVPIGDVAALAERLSSLLRDRGLARDMGARGRDRARDHAVEAIAAKLAAFLTQAAQ